MAIERNIWYRAGYALERARGRASGQRTPDQARPDDGRARNDAPRKASRAVAKPKRDGGALESIADRALALTAVAGGGAMVTAALRLWKPRHKPGPLSLVRAAAAGAGATVARMAFRALLGNPPPAREAQDPLAPVLAGAARGMIYATVAEPRLPGPVVLRGATYGALEFLAEPWGGLEGLLDTLPPHRRIPFLASLLDARDDDPTLAGQLFFGVVLASLYGSRGGLHG